MLKSIILLILFQINQCIKLQLTAALDTNINTFSKISQSEIQLANSNSRNKHLKNLGPSSLLCKRSPGSCRFGISVTKITLMDNIYSDPNYIKLVYSFAYPESSAAQSFNSFFSRVDFREPQLAKYFDQAQKDALIIQEMDAAFFNSQSLQLQDKMNAWTDLMKKMTNSPGVDSHLATPKNMESFKLAMKSENGHKMISETSKNFALNNPMNPSSDFILDNSMRQLKLLPKETDEIWGVMNSNRLRSLSRISDSTAALKSMQVSIGSRKVVLESVTEANEMQISVAGVDLQDKTPVILTVIKDDAINKETAFKNEVFGLKKMNGIVSSDAKSLAILRKPIEGENLEVRMRFRKFDNHDAKELKANYLKIVEELGRKHGLADFSIRPSNVVIDKNGKMSLIHFYQAESTDVFKPKFLSLDRIIEAEKANALKNWETDLSDVINPKTNSKALNEEQLKNRKDALEIIGTAAFMTLW